MTPVTVEALTTIIRKIERKVEECCGCNSWTYLTEEETAIMREIEALGTIEIRSPLPF